MPITLETRGHAAVVTIDLPQKRNSIAPADAVELSEALRDAARAEVDGAPVSGVVLTGNGAFCSGGDLVAFGEVSRTLSVEEIEQHVYRDVQGVLRALRRVPVPTVAAVDGAAVGLGMDLALACDMRFTGPGGSLRQGWARAGLVAATGGIAFLDKLAPEALWRLIATQERLDAEAAAELGLTEAVEGSALDAAVARIDELSTIPADVLRAYVELSRPARWPAAEYFESCARAQAGFIGSEYFRELSAKILTSAAAKG